MDNPISCNPPESIAGHGGRAFGFRNLHRGLIWISFIAAAADAVGRSSKNPVYNRKRETIGKMEN